MHRAIASRLDLWLSSRGRKPLVLRGARQVGKTWLARDLSRHAKRDLVELNFERDPQLARAFASKDPERTLGELAIALGRDIDPARALLFLDEIQARRELIERLRWFAEELPRLPVIAAGSLLDFALADLGGSAPAGRVSFVQVDPMGFEEFLVAHDQNALVEALVKWAPQKRWSSVVHESARDWWRRYAMVGGMPAVVAADVDGAPARTCREIQRDLVATYRADFPKYAGRMDPSILDTVLIAVARSLGQKFVYARAEDGVKQHQAKRALELLTAARLCHLVRWSAANGLPLGGQAKDNFRKAILVDVSIFHALAGTPASTRFPEWSSLAPGVRSQLAEQITAQSLLLAGDPTGDGPELFYWQREGGRPGEIDFLLQAAGTIIPIELKSGKAGSMKSLHQFMFDKRLSLAVRFDENPPSLMDVDVKTTQADSARYRLLSLPLYMASRVTEYVAMLS